MLIEFRVKNFLSIQDEQVFSMVANNDKEYLNNNTFVNKNFRLLNSSVIYGANASGKSKFIEAILKMQQIVLLSAKTQKGEPLPITPFRLGVDDDKKPTMFEISFFIDNIRYQYGFTLDNKTIFEEWLYVYENGNRAQCWFERSYDFDANKPNWYFGSKLLGEKQSWSSQTRENALFLSTAVQLNSKQLTPIFMWIATKIKIININELLIGGKNTVDVLENHKDEVFGYLKTADLDIEDIKTEESEIDEAILKIIPSEILKLIQEDSENNHLKKIDIFTIHKSQDGRKVSFDFAVESFGTQKFFNIIGSYIDCLKNGYVMIHDELNTHLHPILTKFIVELFHDKNINKKNAQLVFTTHETSLLNQNIFRKDQIWFCEKENKASKFYSLSEFKNLRNINYEKAYLSGKFGAIPYLRDILTHMGINNGN